MSVTLLALALRPAEAAPAAGAPSSPSGGAAPAGERVLPVHTRHATAADALAKVLASNPRILGVGELHAKQGAPVAPTTLSRFTTELLPVLAPHTTDLVIETWRLDGRCGPQEVVVAEQVQEDTKRPEATKSELVVLVEAAVAAGVRPHDLAITCSEYERLQTTDGIDYAFLLGVLTDRLGEFAKMAAETPDATMVLYGGAVHNDIAPSPALARYAYGKDAAPRGGYIELDLYDPALLTATPALIEPAWAPLLTQVGPDHVLLYERGPDSFVLILPGTRPTATP